jgi:hypothetical protein
MLLRGARAITAHAPCLLASSLDLADGPRVDAGGERDAAVAVAAWVSGDCSRAAQPEREVRLGFITKIKNAKTSSFSGDNFACII